MIDVSRRTIETPSILTLHVLFGDFVRLAVHVNRTARVGCQKLHPNLLYFILNIALWKRFQFLNGFPKSVRVSKIRFTRRQDEQALLEILPAEFFVEKFNEMLPPDRILQ
jgi:hypothetical protein